VNRLDLSQQFPTFIRMGKGIFRISKWIIPRLFVLALVLAVIHGTATIILGRRLEAKIAAIKARGEPVSMAELGKPKVPDAENAAVIYAKAFEKLSGRTAEQDIKMLERFLSAEEREKNPGLWNEARLVADRLRPALPLVEQAVSRPKCQFPVNWEAGAGAIFPHYYKMRKLAILLRATALLAAKDGRMDEAVRLIEMDFRMSESIKDDPVLIGQLSRKSMIEIGCLELRNALEYGEINETQARRLYDVLAGIDPIPGYVKAMQGDRALGLWFFDYARRADIGELSGSDPTLAERLIAPSLRRWIWRPFLYADEMVYLDYMGKQVDAAHLQYPESKSVDKRLDLDAMGFPPYATLSKFICPLFRRARAARDDGVSELAGTRILLGLLAYKDRFGSYPQTLGELRSRLGWKLPEDPFSGRDFIYKRQGKGFLLYSIGRNLKDDGGRLLPARPSPITWPECGLPSGPQKGLKAEDYCYQSHDGRWSADIVWQMDH